MIHYTGLASEYDTFHRCHRTYLDTNSGWGMNIGHSKDKNLYLHSDNINCESTISELFHASLDSNAYVEEFNNSPLHTLLFIGSYIVGG